MADNNFVVAAFGRLMRSAFNSISAQVKKVRFTKSDLTALMSRSYMFGARAGRLYHSAALGLPQSIPEAIVREAMQQSRNHADQFTGRLEHYVNKRSITTAVGLNVVTTASRIAAWSGADTQGEACASESNSRFKTWVRAWPVLAERVAHASLEGKTIEISQKFELLPPSKFAGVLVAGPRDYSQAGSSEWSGCGHSLVYSRVATKEMMSR